jgi:hypothetical protein
MNALLVFLKLQISDRLWGIILMVGIPLLIVASIVININNAIKKRKQLKDQQIKAELEKDWANEKGIQFFNRLAKMINQNESERMTDHIELDGLESIGESTLNQRFEVTNPKFSLRLWYVVSSLHDRYEMEVKALQGKAAHEAEAEEGINLGADEMLYEKFENCEWYELRRSRQRSFGYHGLGIRIPLGAGISYRAGQIQSIDPQNKGEYQLDSKGVLYVTNLRIIFIGLSENKVIALSAILDLEQFKDSVVIGKSRGKKPLIRFEMDDAALFSRLIIKLFKD